MLKGNIPFRIQSPKLQSHVLYPFLLSTQVPPENAGSSFAQPDGDDQHKILKAAPNVHAH